MEKGSAEPLARIQSSVLEGVLFATSITDLVKNMLMMSISHSPEHVLLCWSRINMPLKIKLPMRPGIRMKQGLKESTSNDQKGNIAMNTWLPQTSYFNPYGKFPLHLGSILLCTFVSQSKILRDHLGARLSSFITNIEHLQVKDGRICKLVIYSAEWLDLLFYKLFLKNSVILEATWLTLRS